MPTYDYKRKECGNMLEVFRRFSKLDKQVNCPNCCSEKNREMGREMGVGRGLC